MQYPGFRIVVQGPLHENSLAHVQEYREYCPVIISYWRSDRTPEGDFDLSGATLVANDLPTTDTIWNAQNVYYQIVNTLAGIMAADGADYVLKLRSDEYVGNLLPFFEAILQNPQRFTCGNLHFRPDAAMKFHPSDKIVGGSKPLMDATYKIARYRCQFNQLLLMGGVYEYTDLATSYCRVKFPEKRELFDHWKNGLPLFTEEPQKPIVGAARHLPHGHIGVAAEQLIGTSFLMARGVFPDRRISREIMREHFRIVRLEDCIPYRDKYGNGMPQHNWVEVDRIEDC